MDVFEGVPAAHKIGMKIDVFLGIVVRDKLYAVSGFGPDASLDGSRVYPDASVGSPFAEKDQEIAFAAPDLDYVFIAETMFFDEPVYEVGGDGVKGRREGLLVFVVGSVCLCSGIE